MVVCFYWQMRPFGTRSEGKHRPCTSSQGQKTGRIRIRAKKFEEMEYPGVEI